MKKVLLTIATVGFAASVLAQGTVAYYNNGTGLKAPVYGPQNGAVGVSITGNTTAGIPAGDRVYTGAALAGSAFVAQFFAANGTSAAESALVGATSVNTFRTGSAAGFLAVTTATLPSVTPDAPTGATLQLRAWDNSSGLYPTWAQAEVAWQKGLIAAGKSSIFTMTSGIGGGVGAAGLPLGLTSFNIYFVPEPSTMALAGLGAAAMLIFRRRK